MNINEIKKCQLDSAGYYITQFGRVKLGDGVTLGDGASSIEINKYYIDYYIVQASTHIFWKWVTKERFSPDFDSGTPLEYIKGATIEVEDAIVSDQQCGKGLHVMKFGGRPEWAGLCKANHDFVPLRVKVDSKDILFAGLPTMDDKLRVKKLTVLD